MSMMRWTPFEEMEHLRRQIDNIFVPVVVSHPGEKATTSFVPPVEVVERPDGYRVRFMLPGIRPDDVKLEASAKTLSISGEIASPALEEKERVLISQFRVGKFSKQLSFPDGIEPGNVEADYVNGILEVKVPKAESMQKRSIEIRVNP